MSKTQVPVDEVQAAESDMAGWCTTCQKFVNHGEVEPDANDYTCEECDAPTVQGAGNALMDELFEVVD